MKKILALSFFCLSILSTHTFAGTVELTTYYPSPFGSYDQLRLIPRAEISDPCTPGTIYSKYYVDPTNPQTLKYCYDDGAGNGSWGNVPGVWSSDDTTNPSYVFLTDITANVDIGGVNPEFRLTLENDGGILAKGQFGLGETLNSAPVASALIWYPKKAAFAAGLSGGNWDNNIGSFSASFGAGLAYGDGSFAVGTGSVPAGSDFAFAAGDATTASGDHSFAIGLNTAASGPGSFAAGENTLASGQRATALGINSMALGDSSFAVGGSPSVLGIPLASGTNSVAIGSDAQATGTNSTAFGNDISVSGLNSIGISIADLVEIPVPVPNFLINQANTLAIVGDSTSKVGIGVASPGALLHIASPDTTVGSIWMGTTALDFAYNGGTDNYFSFVHTGGLLPTSRTSFCYQNTNNELLTIKNSNGFVGIGATANAAGEPKEKLHVKGNAFNANDTIEIEGDSPDLSFYENAGAQSAYRFLVDQQKFRLEKDNNANGLFTAVTGIMTIDNNGKVGIGTDTPSEQLHVVGNILANGLFQASSRTLKDDINELSLKEASLALDRLNPVKFIYKQDKDKELHLGFIAEDVPDLVSTPGRKGIDPMDITAVLTKVIQHQQEQIEKQQEQIEKLKEKVKKLSF